MNCVRSDFFLLFLYLQCLCNKTLRCCSKFFLQMYNIYGLCNEHYVRRNFTIEPTTVHIDCIQCFEKLFRQLPSSAADFTYGPTVVVEDPNYRAWCSLQRQPDWNLQKLGIVSQRILCQTALTARTAINF